MKETGNEKTIREVKRLLNLGRLLGSVLTPEEREALTDQPLMEGDLKAQPPQYVSSSALDEENENVH